MDKNLQMIHEHEGEGHFTNTQDMADPAQMGMGESDTTQVRQIENDINLIQQQ